MNRSSGIDVADKYVETVANIAIDNGASQSKKYPFPWLGLDIGGTLTKLVYFEPLSFMSNNEIEETSNLKSIRDCLTSDFANRSLGVKDQHLELKNVSLQGYCGTLHFICFPNNQIDKFMKMVEEKEFFLLIDTFHVTGGGAYKLEKLNGKDIKIQFNKLDEIKCLIKGIDFLCRYSEINGHSQCYSLKNSSKEKSIIKETFDFRNPYPYIAVNIGSGVSVTLAKSEDEHVKISGSTIGGGTFLGLCCLLSGCSTYEEAIKLATHGDNTKVDKLMSDIYGKNAHMMFGLPEDVAMSSFGKMDDEAFREAASKGDMARALLVMITNNIGILSVNLAKREGVDRIVFLGNFLRNNPISIQLLASAMHCWSRGTKKALFLEHEGYFGAVGALLKNVV